MHSEKYSSSSVCRRLTFMLTLRMIRLGVVLIGAVAAEIFRLGEGK